ncbi:MAG: putative porin [Deltaproteobacteria bacterium]|nr:putative porin [Deltaproteobacteria bacterium]
MKKGIKLKTLILFLAASFLFFTTAQAQESFRFEGEALIHASEDDDDIEVKVIGVGGTFYFTDVNTSDHPYAEAAFLERVGSVYAGVGIGTIDSDVGMDGDITSVMADAEFMQTGSPIFLEASVSRMIIDVDSPPGGDVTWTILGIGGGWFIEDGLRVGVEYIHEEEDRDVPILVERTIEYDTLSVNGKMVKKLGAGRAFNAEATVSYVMYDDEVDDGSNNVLSLSGDYFFNRKMSAGAGLEYNRGDDNSEEGETFAANFTNFFIPRLYITVDVERFEADNRSGSDEDSLDVSLTLRF